ADVHEADGVVSGALQYAEDVVLDVWSFNEYHDGTEKVPLDDTLFSSFDPEKFIEGVIVTSEAFWKQYQEKRGFLLGNIFETMYQVPVIVPEADAVYFGDENIYELLPKGELKDTIYHAFRYALDEKEFI
ncbi:MAG: hypothetical protein GOV00_00900, partial [Candidatus Altiarchaeota archaeon]|nr:hypothetical protein [Candidatus Altiarchaeota archaeon]